MKTFTEFLNEQLNEPDLNFKEIISRLFQSRDISHLDHLSTGSYEIHIALNGYYDEIIPLIDSLIEAYQGLNGKINISIPSSSSNENHNIIEYFMDLRNFLMQKKDKLDVVLTNIIEEIMELITTTIYKIKELS
jgi:hypothetical protein